MLITPADVFFLSDTPTCEDGVMNQGETDVDCGGECGDTCGDNQSCLVDSDCVNNYCTSSDLCGTSKAYF